MDEKFGKELRTHMKERLYEIRVMIDEHVEEIHASITENAKQTLKFIQMILRANKHIRKRPIGTEIAKLDPSMFAVRRLWDQVAAEDESSSSSSNSNDFDVTFNYQPRSTRSKMTKEQQTNKPMEKNMEQKEKPVKRKQKPEERNQKAEERKQNTEERKPKTEERKQKAEERKERTEERKNKPRITKGEAVDEAEKIMALISKDDNQQMMALISKVGEHINNETSQLLPSKMVELIMVNAKVDRFKRKTLTVNGKMVNYRF